MQKELSKEFRSRFQKEPEHIFFCPGRVNLIGEHIDYNGGVVMPCAIQKGTYLAVAKATDRQLHFHSLSYPATTTLHLQESYSRVGNEWFNYPLGVINLLSGSARDFSGLELLFCGDLPAGAGLSSSASIEVVTAFALSEMFGIKMSKTEMALLCKKAENEFIGVNCGIMDQFAVAMGKKDHAVLLHCDSLVYEYIPFETGKYSLVVINSGKERKLAESKYNERFSECGKVLSALKSELPVQQLCEVSSAQLAAYKHLIGDVVLEKRALHVVSENERVLEAKKALLSGNIILFGQLMYESHNSLKENYEVTGKELDTIVDFCQTFPGCIGARMTGAGFGGCAIALVDTTAIDDFTTGLTSYYSIRTGYKPELFVTAAEDGVKKLTG